MEQDTKKMEQKEKGGYTETVVEVTWLYKKLWDGCLIQAISYDELTDFIKEVAGEFVTENPDMYLSKLMFWNKTEAFAKKKIAAFLWEKFGDVPMDPDSEKIEVAWNGFDPGTHREDIWHWFEETFDISVAVDLMHV